MYGEPTVFPTPETCPFPVQTSLYAASKLAGEGMIAAYCPRRFPGDDLPFVSILGERYSHGHVFDFYQQLAADPSQIRVLGDGLHAKAICTCRIASTRCSWPSTTGGRRRREHLQPRRR